jgi:hypothetical protein
MELLKWLQEWYAAQCDGDWEHQNGARITTLDNPGWRVSVSLVDTASAGALMQPYVIDLNDDDWVRCEVRDGRFEGRGDPSKLAFRLEMFRSLVEQGGP